MTTKTMGLKDVRQAIGLMEVNIEALRINGQVPEASQWTHRKLTEILFELRVRENELIARKRTRQA